MSRNRKTSKFVRSAPVCVRQSIRQTGRRICRDSLLITLNNSDDETLVLSELGLWLQKKKGGGKICTQSAQTSAKAKLLQITVFGNQDLSRSGIYFRVKIVWFPKEHEPQRAAGSGYGWTLGLALCPLERHKWRYIQKRL